MLLLLRVSVKSLQFSQNALNQFINDRINDRLKLAMSDESLSSNPAEYIQAPNSGK